MCYNLSWKMMRKCLKGPHRKEITMKKLLGDVADSLWVLQAYLRGKVLRQKAYRFCADESGFALVHPPVTMSVKRMMMLVQWWGFHPMTPREVLKALTEIELPEPVPYANWSSSGWDLSREWKNDFRFLTVLK